MTSNSGESSHLGCDKLETVTNQSQRPSLVNFDISPKVITFIFAGSETKNLSDNRAYPMFMLKSSTFQVIMYDKFSDKTSEIIDLDIFVCLPSATR